MLVRWSFSGGNDRWLVILRVRLPLRATVVVSGRRGTGTISNTSTCQRCFSLGNIQEQEQEETKEKKLVV